jgi:hypothetical protein
LQAQQKLKRQQLGNYKPILKEALADLRRLKNHSNFKSLFPILTNLRILNKALHPDPNLRPYQAVSDLRRPLLLLLPDKIEEQAQLLN